MHREFIETELFEKAWKHLKLTEDDLAALQEELLKTPDKGKLIKGTGGARKMRFAVEGQGKSGANRIIYVDFVYNETIYLLFAYAKVKKESLTDEEKSVLRDMIQKLEP